MSRTRATAETRRPATGRRSDLGADIVVMLHPDYQYTPRLIPAMASMIAYGEFDAVLASRILGIGALQGRDAALQVHCQPLPDPVRKHVCWGTSCPNTIPATGPFPGRSWNGSPWSQNSDDFVFDNQMLAQIVWFGYRIGEVSCPTKYFEEASSINFPQI